MSATVYVQPDSDTLIVDVTGADPSQPQHLLTEAGVGYRFVP